MVQLSWGVEQRLEFIEFRLFWEGHVNRGDITELFGVSVNQASTDLNRYLGLAPENMNYDKSAKTYTRSASFNPLFLKPDASQYLTQIRSIADGILVVEDSWLGQVPPFEMAPTPIRGVDPRRLRSVVAAIRRNESIEVKYQSLSKPEAQWRWIAPHALGFDGFRWHVRAWSPETASFRDFLLSRILETRGTKQSEVSCGEDVDWNTEVTLEIGPHPDLSASQQQVVALDYGMRGGLAKIKVRKALLYYALKRLGLDTSPSARRPQDQQIVLINAKAVTSHLGRAIV